MRLEERVEAVMATLPAGQAQRPVIEKELLHYDILYALSQAGLLELLTFQGGTALRLCYGSARFSEDLDFVSGKDFDRAAVGQMKDCIEKSLRQRYGLDVTVRAPREKTDRDDGNSVRVDRWQVAVVTAPERRDLPKQRIRIEIANVPAYSPSPRPLRRNYAALPPGYEDILIGVESMDEIMADKLLSLVVSTRPRYRDLWDLPWLDQQGAEVRGDWVLAKAADYGIADYRERLERTLEELPALAHGDAFHHEMQRFIPQDVWSRTFDRAGFVDYIADTNQGLLSQVRAYLDPKAPPPDFRL